MKFRLSLLAGTIGLALLAPAHADTELDKLKNEVDALKKAVASASEWKNPLTQVHMAGYADVGYSDVQSAPGSFTVGHFSPIFHYQFNETVMLESELEFAVDETGATEVGLEYLTIDWFMNDHATLVAGKFLSPLGQFRQNMHPSWINKMATMPIGFGEGEATPSGDVGVQVRGGFRLAGLNANYAAYIGNGPTAVYTGGSGFEGIDAGFNGNGDGAYVGGGRFGLLFPDARLEIGLSAATGDMDVRNDTAPTLTYEGLKRDYSARGADLSWRPGNFDIRLEYIQQSVGAKTGSVVPGKADWSAWYGQVAYRFLPGKWEVVARYGNYDTPDDASDRVQLAGGINYVFASNFIGKLNYESNDNPNDGFSAPNAVRVQLAYGF